jgi:hypothetical protein
MPRTTCFGAANANPAHATSMNPNATALTNRFDIPLPPVEFEFLPQNRKLLASKLFFTGLSFSSF